VEPDLVVVRDLSSLSQRGVLRPPLVIVEVISPSGPWLDRRVKFERYAINGVPHYWLVDPAKQTVECHRRSTEGAYVLDGAASGTESLDVPAFPGLTLDLAALWRWPGRGGAPEADEPASK
jgi:Uma2 family endonuclease